MGATFPNGIASFTQKRNLLDDVDANDINKLQDEVKAIEETLGAALITLQQIENEVEVLEDEVNSIEQTDQSLTIKFGSLKDLIMALWEGKNIYGASTSVSNIKLKNTTKDRPYPPGLVHLQRPSTADDPMGMWNGTGFTLKKSGLWVCKGTVQVNLAATGPKSTKNFGTYEGSITINGNNWTRALDRQYPQVDDTWHDVMLNPVLVGWFPAGTRITLRAAQSSDLDQKVRRAELSVFRVRGRA